MSQSAAAALAPVPFELVYSDGEPLEDFRHFFQMNLLIDQVHQVMAERGRIDFFAGGNMFVYYSLQQARDVVAGRSYFRGPDFFFIGETEPKRELRGAWVSWEEGGRLPNVIVELLSPSTAKIDRTDKKVLYAGTFRTPEYFLYDFDSLVLEGFVLAGKAYRPLALNRAGRLRCRQLGLELGLWRGIYRDYEATWLRLFHPDGRLVLTPVEAERQRADAAEAELARLRARLEEEIQG